MPTFWETPEAELLKQLLTKTTQPWPYWFMHRLNALIPMMGVESVILRQREGIVEVLLTQRDGDDLDWPWYYHVPGSTVRDTDITLDRRPDEIYTSVLRRIWANELQLSQEKIDRITATKCDVIPWRHTRGGCISTIFLCQAYAVEFPVGHFHPVHRLPQPFLGGQEILITTAMAYLAAHSDFFCTGLPD
ncbi:MAG: hypothetical protein ACOYUK_04890 [Patescibacteria group bacterium]